MSTNEKQHTPGPWVAESLSSKTKTWGVSGADRALLATCGHISANNEANARLIAAAPDLLNALEMAQATIERLVRHAPGSANGTLDVIKAAITKATGQSS